MVLVGIVGKPNVGKSTFFRALTQIPVEIENRPFVTIDPNVGTAYVRVEDVGPEFNVKSNPRQGFIKGKYRFVPVELMDVAGLVPGAHEGRGLGNKFSDDLRRAEGLILVIDSVGATNEEGEFVGKGNYDPKRDIEFLEEELDWWFFRILKENLEKIIRRAKNEKKNMIKEIANLMSGVNVSEHDVEKAFKELKIDENYYDFDDEITFRLASLLRKYSKPMIIAANRVDIDPGLAKRNIKKLQSEFPDKLIIPTSGYAELILKELDKQGKIEYVPGEMEFRVIGTLNEKEKKALDFIECIIFKEFGGTGVQTVLDKLVFEVLEYIAVFPGGVDKLCDKEGRVLPDCFLLKKGSTVIDFAERIHSDLAKHFVKAIDVRTKKPLGKSYELKHRDVIQIISAR